LQNYHTSVNHVCMSAKTTEISAYLEWLCPHVFIVRCGPGTRRYPDPWDCMAVGHLIEKCPVPTDVTLKAYSGKVSPSRYKAIITTVNAHHLRVLWERPNAKSPHQTHQTAPFAGLRKCHTRDKARE